MKYLESCVFFFFFNEVSQPWCVSHWIMFNVMQRIVKSQTWKGLIRPLECSKHSHTKQLDTNWRYRQRESIRILEQQLLFECEYNGVSGRNDFGGSRQGVLRTGSGPLARRQSDTSCGPGRVGSQRGSHCRPPSAQPASYARPTDSLSAAQSKWKSRGLKLHLLPSACRGPRVSLVALLMKCHLSPIFDTIFSKSS